MRILIVGGGGREHAFAWALARSPRVTWLGALPGNPGIAAHATCLQGAVTDLDAVGRAAEAHRADLVVVGPEAPLAAGLGDHLRSLGIPVFGPSKAAAEIESSKAFARAFMDRHSIPSAGYHVFTDADAARAHLADAPMPCVVKADGLAAGKGAVVCHERSDAVAASDAMLGEGRFGEAGARVLVEEFLVGEEVSVFALTDGERVVAMLPSQDHKAVFDGDRGPNTGGMGAYCPWQKGDDAFLDHVTDTILRPAVRGLAEEGRPFQGCLYAGLMMTSSGPCMVEFNCRFGDPETQVVLPLLETDLAELFLACATGSLTEAPLAWRSGAAVSIVMASAGYPGSYSTGVPIRGLTAPSVEDDAWVFHAGTSRVGDEIVTGGGRVLNVTAVAEDLAAARAKAYRAIEDVQFDGAHWRRDIGEKGLAHV